MNSGLTKRLESVQYSAALAVAGAWKGTSYDKLLDELGWEYLYRRRWFRRLSHFYSIVNGNSPEYLKAELPQPKVYNYNLRSEGVFERSHVRTQRFGNTFFPYCIREWNELHVSIRTVESGIVTIFLSVQFALVGLSLKQLNISSYAANASLGFGPICSTMHAN